MFNESGFMCYAMHQQAIEDFIAELRRSPCPNSQYEQRRIANKVGLDVDAVTSAELDYIQRRVNE